MLINFSNHPLNEWQQPQLDSAYELFGGVIDLPFPQVDPLASTQDIETLAEHCTAQIISIASGNDAVHIMGELTLTFAIINRLKTLNIKCIASCSERISSINDSGQTVRTFIFRQFRPYF